MPSINMIAPRRAEKKRVLRDMGRLTLVICLEILAILAISGYMCANIYRTRARIDDLDIQLQKLQPKVQKIAYFDKATQELLPKVDLLASARDRTMHWYNMMDHLSRNMPNNTWLTRVAAMPPESPDAAEITINLNGVSVSQQLVGEAMLRLQTNPDISNVDLHYTQDTIVGERSAVSFELAAALKTTKSEGQEKGVKKDASGKS